MSRGGTGMAPLLVAAGAVLTAGLVIAFEHVDHLFVFLLVLAMLLMGVVPILNRVRLGKFDFFEPIVPYWAMNFLYYAAGALFVLFVDTVAFDSGVYDHLNLALAYCTLGYACALFGYTVAGSFVHPRPDAVAPKPGWLIIAVLYGIGFSGSVVSSVLERGVLRLGVFVSGFNSLISQLSFLATFTFFYVCYLAMSRKATPALHALLFGVMIPTQAVGLFLRFGNKTNLFLTIGVPILAYWYARRKIAWKTLLAVTLISVFVVFPAYYSVRTFKSPYYSQRQRIEKTFQSMAKQRPAEAADGALRTVCRRLALINSTAIIIRECGWRIDYELGSTLWLGVVGASVPRILWPSKPNINIGKEFGKKFRMTRFGDYSYVSPSQAGELYWNFHVPGIVVGMLLIGIWLRILYVRFGEARRTDPIRLAIYVTLLYAFLASSDGFLGGLEGRLIKEGLILLGLERLLLMMESVATRRAGAPSPAGGALEAR